MGVDSCIYFRTIDGQDPELCDPLPPGSEVIPADELGPDGATHELDQPWRYYAPGYERGDWPKISAALLALFAAENVAAVWYYPDHEEGAAAFTMEQLNAINFHYAMYGDRPYRSKFKSYG